MKQLPWDRPDAEKRYAVMPFSLMNDKAIGGAETLVWLALAGESFVVGSNVIKAGHAWIAKASKLSRPTATAALVNLVKRGYVDVLVGARPGKTGVYKLTPACFAAPVLLLSDKEGIRPVAREDIEDLRKRLKSKTEAKAV